MLHKWQSWVVFALAGSMSLSLVAVNVASGEAGASTTAATVMVRPGQTLTEIAEELHTTVTALAQANGLADPDRILAGSILRVPTGATLASTVMPGSGSALAGSGTVIVVGLGQNLTSIARRYGTTVAALVAANGIANPNRVLAGTHLHIPASPSSSSGAGGGGSSPGGGMQLTSFSVPAALAAYPSRMTLQPDFVNAAGKFHVPLALLEAMCWWESGWQVSIVSPTGAIGVCQIEPFTADFVNSFVAGGPYNPNVAAQNIDLGAAYLASLISAAGGNVGLALAGYYQGLTSVRTKGMYPATSTYVRGIEAYAVLFGG